MNIISSYTNNYIFKKLLKRAMEQEGTKKEQKQAKFYLQLLSESDKNYNNKILDKIYNHLIIKK